MPQRFAASQTEGVLPSGLSTNIALSFLGIKTLYVCAVFSIVVATSVIANSVGLSKREELLLIGRLVILVVKLRLICVRYHPGIVRIAKGYWEQMTHVHRGVYAIIIACESVDKGVPGVEHAEIIEEDQVAGLLFDLDEGELNGGG
jgi:hypothetical protein